MAEEEFDTFFMKYDADTATTELTKKQELLELLLTLEKDMTELQKVRQEQKLAYLVRKQEILKSIPEQEILEYLLKKKEKLSMQVEYIYAIKSDISPNFFRLGTIDHMHNKPLAGADSLVLNQVFAVAPTLHYARDMNLIKHEFAPKLKNNGWYLLFDYEIKKYFDNVIIPKFNQEVVEKYKADPQSTGIPPNTEEFIIPV
jgi:hypothetical protein